jgi:hypothetical protein
MPNPDSNPHSDEFLDDLETAADVAGKAAAQTLALAARLAAEAEAWRFARDVLPAAEGLDRAHGWLDHTLWQARKRPADIEADTDQINLPSTSGTGSGGHPLRGPRRALPEPFRADLAEAEERSADALRQTAALAARAALDRWWWMAASLLDAAGELARAHGGLLWVLEAEDRGRSEDGDTGQHNHPSTIDSGGS